MSASLRRTLLGLAAVLALLLVACGGGDSTGDQAGGDDHAGDMSGDHAAQESVVEPVEGAPEVTVITRDIEFEPTTLELTAGEPTNVTVVNEGQALHDFTLEEAGVHVNVEPGESVTTAVTVDEPGTYQAVCTVPGHEDAGMVVEITVR
jgi:uncharacterized cupredoxin-like copper-binding protein